jgi:uncharacterized membrane protein
MLVLGLIVFLGVHSLRLAIEPWRNARVAQLGETRWKGLYSIISIAGFVLIVVGYGIARRAPVALWAPPPGVRHLTALIVAVAFVLIAAAYVPGSRIKRVIGHPMYAGIAIWAVGHLLANGTVHALVLFGAFFVWAAAGLLIWRHRDRMAHVRYPSGSAAGDARTVALGLVAWALFAFLLHGWLIGVRPLA